MSRTKVGLSGLARYPVFNARMTITTSGPILAPKTGWAKVTLIAGAGAGGDSNYELGGRGGGKGGDTSLAGHTATGGSGGGCGSYATAAGGGGESGEIVEFYIFMTQGVSLGTAVIGAGGVHTAAIGAAGQGTRGGFGVPLPGNASWGTAGQGGGNGGNAMPSSASGQSGCGGNGGSNGTPYGGGGGGAKGWYSNADYTGWGGRGSANGSNGQTGTATGLVYGGNGGPGAIIIEYFDPDFTG